MATGALLATALLCICRAEREHDHFKRLVQSALALPAGKEIEAVHSDENALRIMHKVHGITNSRLGQIAEVKNDDPGFFCPSEEHLIEPFGACATYSQMLAKALKTAGYPVRKVGLSKDGLRSIHHVLEAKIGDRWVLMDAQNDLAYIRPDGLLAGAADVHANWQHYQSQTPTGYNPDYDYSSYYYTNWRKVPVIGAVVEGIPPLHAWLEKREVSLRFKLLDIYLWFTGFAASGAVLLLSVRLWPKIRQWRTAHMSPGAQQKRGLGSADVIHRFYRTTFTGMPT